MYSNMTTTTFTLLADTVTDGKLFIFSGNDTSSPGSSLVENGTDLIENESIEFIGTDSLIVVAFLYGILPLAK